MFGWINKFVPKNKLKRIAFFAGVTNYNWTGERIDKQQVKQLDSQTDSKTDRR